VNEQEIEGQLSRLARSDENLRAPESLRRFMHSLEASPAMPVSGLVGPRRSLSVRLPGLGLARAAAGLAAAAVIAALLLTAVLAGHSSRQPVSAGPAPTFAASAWTKLYSFPTLGTTLYSFPTSSSGYARATVMRQGDGLIYGLLSGSAWHQSARWGTWQSQQVSVAQTVDGRKWIVSDPLSDLVIALNEPPMDASMAYNAVAKRGSTWVVAGGLVGAPAQVAIGDGNQPVESIGLAWVSNDGVRWQQPSSAQFPGYELMGVVAAGSGFAATGKKTDGSGFAIWTSTDGISWQSALAVGATSAATIGSIEFDSVGGYLAVGEEQAAWDGPTTILLFHSADGLHWTQSVAGRTLRVTAGLTTSYVNGRWQVDIVVADQQVGNVAAGQWAWNEHLETLTSSDGVAWSWEQPSTEFRSSPIDYSVAVRHGSEFIGVGVSNAAGAGAASTATDVAGITGPVAAPTEAVPSPEPSAAPSAHASSPVAARTTLVGRTVDFSSWTDAGAGPSGVPTAAVATSDGLMVFVYRANSDDSLEWVEVWSAPWP
jgi:hypothetical protein